MRFERDLSVILGNSAIAALVFFQASPIRALTGEEVNNLAREYTVLIRSETSHGSGFIVSKNGNTYYVVTAGHVVRQPANYRLVTADKQAYQLDSRKITVLSGADLAILEFTSDKNYAVAKLANSDTISAGASIFVSGWPKPGKSGQVVRQFPYSRVSGFLDQAVEGYQMIYTAVTLPGMSGGPVVDALGRVIGVHGMGDSAIDPQILEAEGMTPEVAVNLARSLKTGFNYAIPINTLLQLAPQSGIYIALQVESSSAPELGSQPIASAQPDKRDTIDNINRVLDGVNLMRRVGCIFGACF